MDHEECTLVLQSVLPGLRQLRAPLVAGYVWLLALWLLLHDELISGGSEVRDSLVDLAIWAGKPAVLASSVLVAYLVGTLSIAVTKGLSRATRPLTATTIGRLVPRYWADKQITNALEAAVESRFLEHYVDDQKFRSLLTDHVVKCRERASRYNETLVPGLKELPPTTRLEQLALDDFSVRWNLIFTVVSIHEYVIAAKDDIGHLAYRLLGKEERVYDEYDRLRAEGTFRFGLALPMAVLVSVLAYRDSPWWLIGLVVPIVFAYLGAGAFAESERGLAAAVSSGRVELPSLERIRTRDVKLEPYVELVGARSLPRPYQEPRRRRGTT